MAEKHSISCYCNKCVAASSIALDEPEQPLKQSLKELDREYGKLEESKIPIEDINLEQPKDVTLACHDDISGVSACPE